jgi:Immunoglobulin-like domain of bacterial spore germination
MMLQIMYGLIATAVLFGVMSVVMLQIAEAPLPSGDERFCTMDALQCPDGSFVGRTGPNCEFVCPTATTTTTTVSDSLIIVDVPLPNTLISSPLQITGKARGPWYFEASFPVSVVNWDGLIIAEGIATAEGDWMTEDFVPFTATLTFTSPYQATDPVFMQKGALILQKDNPSGLPEHDAAIEIPLKFSPVVPAPE